MNLKEYLDENRITYREFAEMLGIHLQSLKNIAYGKRKPSLNLALRIEELSERKVSPRDLIGNLNEISKKKLKRKSVKKQLDLK